MKRPAHQAVSFGERRSSCFKSRTTNLLADSAADTPNVKKDRRSESVLCRPSLDGKKVLFVRNRCGNDPVYLNGDYGDIQPDQCMEIQRALSTLLPRTQFDLFATNKPGFEAFSYCGSEIFSDSIIEYGDCSDYMVSPQGWAEMFERNHIVLRAAPEASARAVLPTR